MSDEAAVGSTSLDGSTDSGLTAGALLRNAREAAGLHVAALAVSMKVPVKKLEALEADRLDLLPDAVFVRALASSVCRTLKIDAAPVLKLLPQTSVPRLDTEERGINTPFHAAGDFKGGAWPSFVTRPAVLWVVALLLGVLAVAFFPESGITQITAALSMAPAVKEAPADVPNAPAVAATPVTDTAPVAVAPPEPVKPVEIVVPAAAVTSTPANLPAANVALAPTTDSKPPQTPPAASTPLAAPASGVSLNAKVAAATLPAAAASSVPAPVSGIVTLKAKGETWVEVTDAKGTVQLRKILVAGEAAGASGALPLSVVIGRADMTSVQVRGLPYSLDSISKDNVARFEVK